jgi:hypothetical protein
LQIHPARVCIAVFVFYALLRIDLKKPKGSKWHSCAKSQKTISL